jgi:hypothetical protein
MKAAFLIQIAELVKGKLLGSALGLQASGNQSKSPAGSRTPSKFLPYWQFHLLEC